MSVVVLAVVGAGLPASAMACSCATVEPREQLENGDPAFTGRVVSRRKHESNPMFRGDGTFTYVFRVGHSYNRERTQRLRLTAGTQQAACGFIFTKGERVGAFLFRSGGKLTTNLCSLVDPDALIRAGRQIKNGRSASSPARPRAARSGGSCRSVS